MCACIFYFGESLFFGCVAAVAFADVAVIVGVAVCFTFNMDVWKSFFFKVIVNWLGRSEQFSVAFRFLRNA